MSEDIGGGNRTSVPFRTLSDFGYDEETGVYRARYDAASAHELLVDVVLAVADIEGVTTDDIEPASRSVDADVFETLVRASDGDDGLSTGPLTFSLGDCRVTVVAGEITFDRQTS